MDPHVPASRAWATGPVDVLVLNHHGNPDSTTPFFLSVLQARVCIAQVWDAQHVDPIVLGRLRSDRIAPGLRDIFMTNGGGEGRAEHVVRDSAWRHPIISHVLRQAGHRFGRLRFRPPAPDFSNSDE